MLNIIQAPFAPFFFLYGFLKGFSNSFQGEDPVITAAENLRAQSMITKEEYVRVLEQRTRRWSKRHRDQKF